MGSYHVVFLGFLMIVLFLGINEAQNFTGSGNLVVMGLTVVFQRRGESFAIRTVTISTALLAVFFKQRIDFRERL